MKRISSLTIGVVATATLLAACSSTPAADQTDATGEGGGEVVIGAMTSLSGANSLTGQQWLNGFHAGWDYLTDGTGVYNGTTITIEDVDDASDPNVALTEGTNLVSEGVQIITGTQSSSIAIGLADFAAENDILYLVGNANSDALTAVNRNTFRGSRQGAMDINTIVEALGDSVDGAKIVMLGHDTEYSKNLIQGFRDAVGDSPSEIVDVLAPFPTPDVAPFVQRVKDEAPDILIPVWTGDTTPIFQALAQQGVIEDTADVVSNIGLRGSWPVLQQVSSPSFQIFTPYAPGQLDNEYAEYLDANVDDVDYTAADGFTCALMLAHAIEETKGQGDVDAMITALEGYSFDGPRGAGQIRAEDHAFIAPMYIVDFSTGEPVVTRTIEGDEIAPPVKPMGG